MIPDLVQLKRLFSRHGFSGWVEEKIIKNNEEYRGDMIMLKRKKYCVISDGAAINNVGTMKALKSLSSHESSPTSG